MEAEQERIQQELGISDPAEFKAQWQRLTPEAQADLIAQLPKAPRKRAPRKPKPPVFPVTVTVTGGQL